TTGYRSTGGEPFGSAGGKISSGYELKLNKVGNAFIHARPLIARIPAQQHCGNDATLRLDNR
ncbi:MAG: hypothetical protein PHQ97_09790, partial [Desulfobacterales bacterium]|nr:hypothetical protein [Desulfobacterales bacterium]